MFWKDERELRIKCCLWEDKLTWFKSSSQNRILDTIDGEPMELEWNIFPGFSTLQLVREVQEFCEDWAYNQKLSLDGLSSCRCSTTLSWWSKEKKQECESSAQLVSLHAKGSSPRQWSFFGLGSEKKWYSTHEYNPQGEWDSVAEEMMITFAENRHPNLLVHESIIQRSAQKQRWWKIVNTLLCRWRDGSNCFSHNYFC